MAARENQGYLIAVIILVLLTLVLALVAFFGMSKAAENSVAKTEAEQDRDYYKEFASAQDYEIQILKAMIGNLGPSIEEYDSMLQQIKQKSSTGSLEQAQQESLRNLEADVVAIKEQFDQDVEGRGAVGEEGTVKPTTYREAMTDLINISAKKVKENNIKTRETQRARDEAEQQIAQMQATVKSIQDEMEKLRTELEEEKQRSQVNEARLKDEVAQASQNLDDVNQKFEEYQDTATRVQRDLNEMITNLKEENQIVKAKLNSYEREVFVNADGMVTQVSPSLGVVFINLGSQDGLTKNMTFSVYDKDVKNFDRGSSKAAIEIVDVTANGAEARITQQDPVTPILPGDHILSPTWDPGYPTKIALVGLFDLDGDGVDDTEKLARLIERNGGVVIAKHDADGNIEGAIDPTTRYIVQGNAPIIEGTAALTAAMENLKAQAERNTVEAIDLQKLLNRMGVKRNPKMQSLAVPSKGLEAATADQGEEK